MTSGGCQFRDLRVFNTMHAANILNRTLNRTLNRLVVFCLS